MPCAAADKTAHFGAKKGKVVRLQNAITCEKFVVGVSHLKRRKRQHVGNLFLIQAIQAYHIELSSRDKNLWKLISIDVDLNEQRTWAKTSVLRLKLSRNLSLLTTREAGIIFVHAVDCTATICPFLPLSCEHRLLHGPPHQRDSKSASIPICWLSSFHLRIRVRQRLGEPEILTWVTT